MTLIKGVIFDYNRTVFDPVHDSLMPGAKVLLDYLTENDIKLTLLSKSYQPGREQQIRDLGISGYFEEIIVTYEDKQPSHFYRLLREMGLQPGEVCVIGDRIKSEIVIANQLGMKTIWLKQGKFKDELPEDRKEVPDITITSLEEIINAPYQYLNC